MDNLSVNFILNSFRTKPEEFWDTIRKRRALELFYMVSKRVPAYKDFLKKRRVNPSRIKTWHDFQKIPPISKKNYLYEYPLEKLCWDGSLKKPLVFTSTSGSTGEPFYFPREENKDWEYSVLAELFLKNSSYGTQGPVLIIIAFSMGVWIGGLISYKAFEIAGRRGGYPISLLTPGINKKEIFHALKKLAPHFRQTILVGYAPFIKDIIDEAPEEGINLKKLNLRFLFAAEAFTEKFRDYITIQAGVHNPYLDSLNIYGSADMGAMAYETPTAILMRRLIMQSPELFRDVFSSLQKTPTLAQYNPLFITFEGQDGEILLTGNNMVPLVRYAIGDHGGVLTFSEIVKALKEHHVDFYEEASKVAIRNSIYKLPFVYVYERIDLATTLYGLQIYPELIREALLDKMVRYMLTGKFTAITKFDRRQNQYLEINLELKKGKTAGDAFKKLALAKIMEVLRQKNSEFRELSDHLKNRALPKLVFWPAEHLLYFKPGIKQKWVKKNDTSI